MVPKEQIISRAEVESYTLEKATPLFDKLPHLLNISRFEWSQKSEGLSKEDTGCGAM